MESKLNVYKNRTNIISVGFGYDVSGSTFESEIRVGKDSASDLIATWTITFATDGTDGELIFTLDDAVSATITNFKGFMDIKKVTGGEPLPVINGPIEVFFKDQVTA